ncbi:MAG: hypothetical protein GC159_12175 [Phycisphaera sp.]|nr:hypothetical protein [Phycisphaera sp.]
MTTTLTLPRRALSLYRHWLDVLLPAEIKSGDAAIEGVDWSPDAAGEYCGRCGATAARESITISGCPHCRDERVAWHNVWRLGAYRDPLDQWVRDYKFRRAYNWGPWFAQRLADVTPTYDKQVVVPVPLHWSKRLDRGFDQAMLLARPFAEAKRAPVANLLRRTRRTYPQSLLRSKEARRRNVVRAFAVKRAVDLTGYSVWLVDDVKTSGNTAKQCTRLLQRMGAERVNLAVIAVADPKHADFQRN